MEHIVTLGIAIMLVAVGCVFGLPAAILFAAGLVSGAVLATFLFVLDS